MNKLLLFLFLIVIVALVLVYSENRKLNSINKEQKQKLEVSEEYIEHITNEINKMPSTEETDISNSDRLRNALNNYLQKRKTDKEKNKVNVDNIHEKLSQNEKKGRFIPNLIPINGDYAISQRYSEDHPALDFAAANGTEVVAAAAGVVRAVYEDDYFGIVMTVDHLNEYSTLYAHLSAAVYETRIFVEKGETIALVGNTGNSSAPHLHFEIIKNDEYLDPGKFLVKE
ncbi:MAG: M23 family metallopeptidase [Candidatus Cloacimonetes bacterium]|nr:M23 family metallopeptidase [Candidatus Cloacimonadota bacterium]